MKGGYILANGKFFPENEPLLAIQELENINKGIAGSFRAENNMILFAEENYNHLQNSFTALGISGPKEWDIQRFKKDVSRLLNKNHHFLAAKINIHFINKQEGTDYYLSSEEVTKGFFPINETGLLLDFYEEEQKSCSKLSHFEISSRFLWISALLSAKAGSKNNLFISNTNRSVCEGIATSFAFIKENNVIFPSKDSGGYFPPLNTVVKQCVKYCGFNSLTVNSISQEDLLNADEIFLIDNVFGIQKVLGLKNRRFYCTKTEIIAKKLREMAIQYASSSV